MKSTIAIIPAFLATAALADRGGWGYTWSWNRGGKAWTSCTSAVPTPETPVAPVPAVTSPAPTPGISTTCYSATYSSENSTWVEPVTVSYSTWEDWTSIIPAPPTPTPEPPPPAPITTAPSSTPVAPVVPSSTPVAPVVPSSSTPVAPVVPSSTPVAPVMPSSSSPAPSTFTGAAVPNVNGKVAGVGAMAVAGLALVL